jgi:hypothetical protein
MIMDILKKVQNKRHFGRRCLSMLQPKSLTYHFLIVIADAEHRYAEIYGFE